MGAFYYIRCKHCKQHKASPRRLKQKILTLLSLLRDIIPPFAKTRPRKRLYAIDKLNPLLTFRKLNSFLRNSSPVIPKIFKSNFLVLSECTVSTTRALNRLSF